MISYPGYMSWKSQHAARRARSCFNGCLASMTFDHGCYIIHHNGIKATIRQGLFDTSNPGDLTDVGLSMFLVDIVLLIECIHKPFQVAQEARQLLFWMSEDSNYKTWMQQCSHWLKCLSKVKFSSVATASSYSVFVISKATK